MLLRPAIEDQPGGEPDDAEYAGRDEGEAPAILDGQPWHQQRRDDRADIGAGVEQADREGAFLLREPFGHRLDAGGEIAGFADAQAKAGEGELGHAMHAAMGDMGDRPDDDRDGIAQPRADRVDQAAKAQITDRIGRLEPEDDIGIVGFRPVHLGRQSGLQHADHLPVDIVDRGGGEQQPDDHPAIAPDPLGCSGDGLVHSLPLLLPCGLVRRPLGGG